MGVCLWDREKPFLKKARGICQIVTWWGKIIHLHFFALSEGLILPTVRLDSWSYHLDRAVLPFLALSSDRFKTFRTKLHFWQRPEEAGARLFFVGLDLGFGRGELPRSCQWSRTLQNAVQMVEGDRGILLLLASLRALSLSRAGVWMRPGRGLRKPGHAKT